MAAVFTCSEVLAETVYVHDKLYVPLRSGKTNEYNILHKGIRSGTAMERLEEDPQTGYSRVRMGDGLEGWIQTQYLVTSPIAADLLDQMTLRMNQLTAEHSANLTKLADLTAQQTALIKNNQALEKSNQALALEVQHIKELAADVLDIQRQNQALTAERETLLVLVDELQQTHATLEDRSDQDWFLRGAGTVLLSLLLGFFFARRIYHRRVSSGWV
jgi:SH3 domain protein